VFAARAGFVGAVRAVYIGRVVYKVVMKLKKKVGKLQWHCGGDARNSCSRAVGVH